MSKQLLHTCQSHVAVAALNDRAFALIKNVDSTSVSSAPNVNVLELMAPSNATKNGDDGVENKKDDPSSKKQGKKKKQKNNNQGTSNPHEIQAVCSAVIDSRIWLAVSREDKTLSLYSIPSLEQKDPQHGEGGEEKSTASVSPSVTYNLPKRARCLAFCSVPSSSPSGNKCHVIIAGDLSGDAIAFPVSDDTKSASTTRRLLLGHTASILTGLNVVPATLDDKPRQKQLVLTADRDEKIRVSYFPETHIIHGYLLGHSSFISTMDASTDVVSGGDDGGKRRSLCITGSGDGTVRLWDYQTCKEVGMVPVVIKKSTEAEDEKREDDDDQKLPAENKDEATAEDMQEDGDDEDFDEDLSDGEQSYDAHAIAVPISVTLSRNEEHVIVARDGIASIDIHPIPPPPSKSSSSSVSLLLSHLVSLHKKQTVECPSQPLAVQCLSDGSVLVLARDPDYLLHFQCSDSQTADAAEFNNVSATSPFSTALREAVKSQSITMPMTTLERDEDGELKLQKNKVNDPADPPKQQGDDGEGVPKSGLFWNDAGRKDMAKAAEARRKKRRREDAKKEREDEKKESDVASGDS